MTQTTSNIFSVIDRVVAFNGSRVRGYLDRAQYFEVSDTVMGAVDDLAREITTTRDDMGHGMIPEGSRLPSEVTILWFSELRDNVLMCHRPPEGEKTGEIRVSVLSSYMPALPLGDFLPGSVEAAINQSEAVHEEHKQLTLPVRAQMVVMASAVLAVINEPRITKRVVAGTRQSRRAMQRRFGAGGEQWHRIEWDLTKPKVERGERLGKGWHMPLHYTRGHWRRSEEGRGKAVLLPGRGWHTWVDGFWSGHPAYGIKRAVYAPRIGDKVGGRDRRTEVEGCEAAQ